MRRIATALPLSIVSLLLLAGPALAAAAPEGNDNGEGIVGETDDKIITFFSLGLVIFFTVFVILASWIQGALDRRKQQRKAVELRKRVGMVFQNVALLQARGGDDQLADLMLADQVRNGCERPQYRRAGRR